MLISNSGISTAFHSSATVDHSGKRPKLLFLAWQFPPAHAISSVRTWNIAKNLSRLGWDVTVVTPAPKLFRHLDNTERANADLEAEGIRQILTTHHWRCLAPVHLTHRDRGLARLTGGMCRVIARRLGIDRGIGWVRAAERACRRLDPRDVDLIFASGPPFATFMLAERLAMKLGRPYALDYRDPWIMPQQARPLHPLQARREARLLAGSVAVTTVSPTAACELERRYKLGSKLRVITNGYDGIDLANVKPRDFGHFAIVYAGIFYTPERVITPVLAALKQLETSARREWYFHYYGEHDDHVREEAARFGIAHRVKLHGRVPRSEALSAIRGANIAVVITSILDQPSIRMDSVPGKIFEIIGLRSPMLLIAPPGSDVDSITQTSGLTGRFGGNEIDGIRVFIEKLMAGDTPEKKDSTPFEWQNIARSLDLYLRAQLMNLPCEVMPD